MGWSIIFLERGQHFVDSSLSYVYQHVRIGKPFHGANLVALQSRGNTVQGFSTIVLLKNLLVGDRRHSVIVEFKPSCFAVGFDEGKVMPTMEITRVDENTV
jgi:hypothetical protein